MTHHHPAALLFLVKEISTSVTVANAISTLKGFYYLPSILKENTEFTTFCV